MLKNPIDISATPFDFSVLGPMILTHLLRLLRLVRQIVRKLAVPKLGPISRFTKFTNASNEGFFVLKVCFGGGKNEATAARCYWENPNPYFLHWYFGNFWWFPYFFATVTKGHGIPFIIKWFFQDLPFCLGWSHWLFDDSVHVFPSGVVQPPIRSLSTKPTFDDSCHDWFDGLIFFVKCWCIKWCYIGGFGGEVVWDSKKRNNSIHTSLMFFARDYSWWNSHLFGLENADGKFLPKKAPDWRFLNCCQLFVDFPCSFWVGLRPLD